MFGRGETPGGYTTTRAAAECRVLRFPQPPPPLPAKIDSVRGALYPRYSVQDIIKRNRRRRGWGGGEVVAVDGGEFRLGRVCDRRIWAIFLRSPHPPNLRRRGVGHGGDGSNDRINPKPFAPSASSIKLSLYWLCDRHPETCTATTRFLFAHAVLRPRPFPRQRRRLHPAGLNFDYDAAVTDTFRTLYTHTHTHTLRPFGVESHRAFCARRLSPGLIRGRSVWVQWRSMCVASAPIDFFDDLDDGISLRIVSAVADPLSRAGIVRTRCFNY